MSHEIQKVFNEADKLARSEKHIFLTLEHFFLKLLDQPIIIEMFQQLEFDINQLREDIKFELNKDYYIKSKDETVPEISNHVKKLFQFFQAYMQSHPKKYNDNFLLFFSFYNFPDSVSFHYLQKIGLTKDFFVNYINSQNKENRDQSPNNDLSTNAYLSNLNEKIKGSQVDPIIGRENEIDRVIQVILRKKKNNPILVGEPGVGKTAIAEGLAYKIVNNQIIEELKDHTVFSLNLGSLMAGTKFRGDFEDRLNKVINKIKSNEKNILFIDEIHTIIGAGTAGSGSLDVSNLLKPVLSSGEIKCIGATTFKEYRNLFEKDAALSRRFQKIDVDEPSINDTKKILYGLKPYYEKHHSVKYTQESIDLAVELAGKYISDRFFPDKAIDILDEAGVLSKLENKEKIVTQEIIEKVLSKIAKIPEKTLVSSEKNKIKDLQLNLEMSIFGQKEAVSTLVESILLNKSGLRDLNKPIGSFLFCGPTGVGKTELSKQLAYHLGINFVRIDMSEYMEKHNVSKLIGAPPGYVGYDQEGILTSSVIKNPHSVVLLDEIEKSHPDIWNVLLQIMDNGFITDNFGKKIDFRNVVLIMTSNVGSFEINQKTIGIADSKNVYKPTEAIERTFSPEFRNRLDSIVWFNSLNNKTIKDVLQKNLVQLDVLLSQKNIVIQYSELAKEWLSNKGYNPTMGARPMTKLIQEKIKSPLSKEIIFGKLENGGSVFVDVKDNDIVFKFEKKKLRERKKNSLGIKELK